MRNEFIEINFTSPSKTFSKCKFIGGEFCNDAGLVGLVMKMEMQYYALLQRSLSGWTVMVNSVFLSLQLYCKSYWAQKHLNIRHVIFFQLLPK